MEDKYVVAFNRMRSAKENSGGDFRRWLKDFLVFANTPNVNVDDLVGRSLDSSTPWSCMKSEEQYLRCKDKATSILKYAIQSFTYYDKKYGDPGVLTNVKKVGLDYERICDAFDMNFFNFENKKIVLYAFTEALDKACRKMNSDSSASGRPGGTSRPTVQAYELMRNFYAIYFANLSQKEEDYIMKGDPKTRFTELYLKLVNSKLSERGNKSLVIDPKLYDILDPITGSKIRRLLDTGEKPSDEDFYDAMLALASLEASRKRDNPKLLWTSGDGKEGMNPSSFSLFKAEKGEYSYLANNESGVVLKVFPTTDKRLVIPEIKKIIDND